MATLNPFDDDANMAHMRLPWMALFIIAMITLAVGWMVFTATPSIADTSGDPNHTTTHHDERAT